jgi:hypothetical protein
VGDQVKWKGKDYTIYSRDLIGKIFNDGWEYTLKDKDNKVILGGFGPKVVQEHDLSPNSTPSTSTKSSLL